MNENENNYKQVQLILFVILILNLLVATLKIFIGTLIFSASMTADGYHSLSDGLSNVVGMIGIKFASKPEDDEHPYGHNKIEAISGLGICALLFIVGVSSLKNAYEKFMNPTPPSVTTASLGVLIFTLILNIIITRVEKKKGEELKSTILISDANHTKSDIFISTGVLITLVGMKLGLPTILDTIVTVIVSLFIFHASWEVFEENLKVLIDTSLLDKTKVEECIYCFEDVKGAHYIRSRGTRNNLYVDMHILVDPEMTVLKSHELQHDIEKKIRETIDKNTNVIIHVEPYDATRDYKGTDLV